MKIVCISDTHGKWNSLDLPKGDVLIHAGDIFAGGRYNREMEDFNEWLGVQDFEHKLIIAGNHDWLFETNREYMEVLLTNGTYLENSGVTIEGINFWGSPYTPMFYNWAFMLQRGTEIRCQWDKIPGDTDVLITHGPSMGTLDLIEGENAGCEELRFAIERVKPSYHIFGHIHAAHGTIYKDGVNSINSSICTEAYKPVNKPFVFTYGEDV